MSNLVTPIGRLSFPALFEPKAAVDGATPKYGATLLLDKTEEEVQQFMAGLKKAIFEAVEARWPNPATRPKQLQMALKDGDTDKFTTGARAGTLRKEKYPEIAGHWMLKASGNSAPGIVDVAGNQVTDPKIAYPGVRTRISFNVYTYDNVNVGVGFGLGNVLIVGGGDSFGNATRPEEDFAKFFEEAQAAGGDGETAGGVEWAF